MNCQELLDAAKNGNLEEVQRLVQTGIPLDAGNNNNWTPLHFAAALNGDSLVVEYLIQAGASSNSKSVGGYTPLHLAMAKICWIPSILECLIQAGASINDKIDAGWTPLHIAADNCALCAVKLLLENGADCTIRNDDGNSAKDLAQMMGSEEIIKILQEYEDYIVEVKDPGYC